MHWLEYIPLINTFMIMIAIPVCSAVWRIRKDDIDRVERRFDKLEFRIDRLEARIDQLLMKAKDVME